MRSARPRLKHYIGHHETRTTDDFLELALGTPPELWLGVEGETAAERAARQDAARDILADNPELFDRVARVAAEAVEALAPEPFNVTALSRPRALRRPSRKAAA